MKCKIPEISWHNRDPVLSVDIQPKTNANNYYRLASGGTDAHVLIWYMKLTSTEEYGDIELDLAADLTRHQRAVNAVKWSPNGELLASGDDESVVFIWKLKSDSEPVNILDPTNEQDKEVWITLKVLRGHMEDIYDLSWSPNSLYLVSGSVDNSAMVWDVQKGKSMSILKDHKGFVQGVAWDPKNQYIATLSTDRYLRIFDIQTKKVLYRVSKGVLPVSEDNPLHGKRMRLFHDDTLQTFFRRLSFTPDGKLLLTPAGVTDYDGCTSPINTTYAFSRYGFRQPAIVLPCPDQYTVAVRCCPVLYKLRPFNAEKNPPVVPLPYRMIFAVATKSSVYFYDTQQKQPFALISNIHYTRLTDITWSNDGRIVVVSSTDGFCSLITFEQGELGEEYEYTEAVLEAALAQVTKKTKKQKDTEATPKSRKPSTDDSVLTKQNDNKPKEGQMEKIVEQEIPKNEDMKKSAEELPKENEEKPLPTPIAIKRKPGPTENQEKDNKANPIAIKRKPGPVEDTQTIGNNSEQKPTPIAIKRKPGPVENKESIKSPEKVTTTKTEDTKQPGAEEDEEPKENKDEQKPTPIAIKRKPTPVESADPKMEQAKEKDSDETAHPGSIDDKTAKEKKAEQKPTPIAIKRKPTPVDIDEAKRDSHVDKDSSKASEETTPPKIAAIIPTKVLAAEIIIDKEILSSEEKFESPEKKSRPATPILVRRHPRTPSSAAQTPTTSACQTPTSMSGVLKTQLDSQNLSPLSSLAKEVKTPRQDKKATPIAVRRAPRAIITTPSVVNPPSMVEEAMDAWPSTKDSNIKETPNETVSKNNLKESGINPLPISEATCERTEDIRLVYEETNEETPVKESLPNSVEVEEKEAVKESLPKPLEVEEKLTPLTEQKSVDTPKQQTPSGTKTPRRVALKTISTPKSKKKLLD